ncbi:MAG: PilZ domain-containing protein [candidate division NC10 bacterium]
MLRRFPGRYRLDPSPPDKPRSARVTRKMVEPRSRQRMHHLAGRPDPRLHLRYSIHLPLVHRAKSRSAISAGMGWTRNLSEAGACLELSDRLQPKDPVRLRLQTEQGAIEVEARVIWTGEPDTPAGCIPHGVVFIKVAPDQRQTLRGLLRSMGPVRHAGTRLPLDVSVTCRRKDREGPSFPGRTGNIGRGGLLLQLSKALPPGTPLEVTLHTAEELLTVQGTIAWSDPPQRRNPGGPIRHGFRFTALDQAVSLLLGFLLSDPL